MQQKEFSLRECYVLSCYGLQAVINAGRLEGFTKENKNETEETYREPADGIGGIANG